MSILTHTFPPTLKDIYDEELANQLARTQGAISALNQLDHLLLNPNLLMRPILGKEAESSAQLEGTQASLEDAYKIDIATQTPEKRVEALEIRNYEEAMLIALHSTEKYGLTDLVIREAQEILTKGTRGKDKHPGQYRKRDVWIGDLGTVKEEARYIAPDALHVPALMKDLLSFISNYGTLHPLVASAVVHHRFEAIHPFEDGNGRTGRLLISLFLINENTLSLPILYPSGYFEKNRKQYINNLSNVDNNEDWRPWIMFYLRGLENQATIATKLGLEMNELFRKSRALIDKERASMQLIRVFELTFTSPYFTAPIINERLGIPKPTCIRYLKTLESKRIIQFETEIKKTHVYSNHHLLDILRKI